MSAISSEAKKFDTGSAVTRSLLGWGVVAGPFYLVVGVVQALVRDGFDFGAHPLSLLMLGDWGWIQRVNLILAGLMTLAAAVGFVRAMDKRLAGILVGGYAVCLVLGGSFAPDPMPGFPEGAPGDQVTATGMLHLLFGGIGFLLVGVACFVVARWSRRQGERSYATLSLLAGIVVIGGFFSGIFLPSVALGVLALWIVVVVGWAWLAATSVRLYRTMPCPG